MTLPPTAAECGEEIESLLDRVDSVELFEVLFIICDKNDESVMDVMMEIYAKKEQFEQSSSAMVLEILQISQSNFDRSVEMLYRAAILDEHAMGL